MSRRQPEEQDIKRMADLLRQGSTLTDLACPACASPIFRLRNGDLWCGKCQKKVVVVKEGESAEKITGSMILESVETTLLEKIQEIQGKMQKTQDAEELQRLGTTLNGLLETLEKTKKARNA